MSFGVNIGSDELVKFTNRLEKMRKSDLPVVMRKTLNDAAFDTRSESMPKVYAKQFTTRSKGFLKHSGGVKPAKGWDTKNMSSWVGIRKGIGKAAEGLSQQEKGANVKRSLIPLRRARIGNNSGKKVSKRNQLSEIEFKNPIPKRNKKKMIIAAKKTGKGGFIAYGKRIYKVTSAKNKVRLKPLYAFEKDRPVKIKPTSFLQISAQISGKNLASNFVKQAKIRFRR